MKEEIYTQLAFSNGHWIGQQSSFTQPLLGYSDPMKLSRIVSPNLGNCEKFLSNLQAGLRSP